MCLSLATNHYVVKMILGFQSPYLYFQIFKIIEVDYYIQFM